MNARSKIFWAIWLVFVIAVLWWMSSLMAHGSHHIAPKPITQGLGSADLIARQKATHKRVLLPRPLAPLVRTWYFAATATDSSGLESDFSNEVAYTNWTRTNVVLTLAWDHNPGENVVTNYTIYKGLASGNYPWRYYAQTNRTLTIPIYGFPLSNVVITVVASNATQLMFKDGLRGTWFTLLTNYWRATNPPSPRFFRSLGTNSGSRVFINAIQQ